MFDKGISIVDFTKKTFNWVFTLLVFFLLGACGSDEDYKQIPDVSGIDVDISIRRFEQDLFGLDTANLESGLPDLFQKYPEFSEIYFSQILRVVRPGDDLSGVSSFVRGFLQHPSTVNLYDTSLVMYADLSAEELELEQAFRFLKYYFPEMPVPDVTTFISEYGVGNFIYGDQSLAIGLDFFSRKYLSLWGIQSGKP